MIGWLLKRRRLVWLLRGIVYIHKGRMAEGAAEPFYYNREAFGSLMRVLAARFLLAVPAAEASAAHHCGDTPADGPQL